MAGTGPLIGRRIVAGKGPCSPLRGLHGESKSIKRVGKHISKQKCFSEPGFGAATKDTFLKIVLQSTGFLAAPSGRPAGGLLGNISIKKRNGQGLGIRFPAGVGGGYILLIRIHHFY